ncbi:MAG: SDR family NAD(P)-dependent oxidoreductase [Christensenellaceae bacterium]|jgi:NAD(P)-dependent dehydrogenase (short-subunit alcohol dehydrogenase family)
MALTGKVVFVTGAARGIGRAAARIMAEQGAKIVAVDMREEGIRETAELIQKGGGQAIAVTCDISSNDSVEKAVKTAVDEYGRIDVLFNNAGIVGPGAKFLEIKEEDYDMIMGINTKGPFLVSRAVGKVMKQQGGGRIINTSSVSGKQAEYGATVYCMSKAAVSMLTQALAIELGEYGVSAVAICPGHIKTPMLTQGFADRAKAEGKTEEEYYAEHTKQIPIGRFAEPEEIGALVAYLADEKSYYVDGCDIIASGGQITH